MKSKLKEEIKIIEEQLWKMSDQLYGNPELGDQEFEFMKLLDWST